MEVIYKKGILQEIAELINGHTNKEKIDHILLTKQEWNELHLLKESEIVSVCGIEIRMADEKTNHAK